MPESRETVPPRGAAASRQDGIVRILWRTPFLRASWVALFISGIGVSSAMPQLTLFLVDELHLSIAMAGLYYLVNLVAPLTGFLLGSLSDRLPDRLLLFRICAVVAALGWLAMSQTTQIWMPFVIGGVALTFGGASMGQLFAAVRDELTRHPSPSNSRVIASVRMAFSAGWIVGPVLGSWFGATFGLRPLPVATAVCALAQIVPLGLRRVERVTTPPVPADSPGGTPRPGSLVPLGIFLACSVLLMSGDTMKFGYLPLYMANQLQLPDLLRGAVIGIQPLVELLLMPFFALLADRIRPIRVLMIGAGLGIAAHLAYATSTGVAGLIVGQLLMSGLWAAVAGLGITVAQQLSPHRIGLASSMYMSSLPLSGALGGALGALGVTVLGMPQLFFLPAVLAALGLVGLLVTDRRYRPDDRAFAELR